MSAAHVIGIDPGLRAFGIAVLQVWPRVMAVGTKVVCTQPTPKKRRLREGDDQTRRVQEIARALLVQLSNPHLRVIAVGVESGVIPMRKVGKVVKPMFTPTAIISLGRARGVVDGIATARGLPMLEWTPQELKKEMTGSGNASKSAVITSVRAVVPDIEVGGVLPANPKLWEHACDAMAAAYLASRSSAVQTAVNLLRGQP